MRALAPSAAWQPEVCGQPLGDYPSTRTDPRHPPVIGSCREHIPLPALRLVQGLDRLERPPVA
eukprot:904282-Pyramimonas_sp.AAC.1